MSRPPHRDATAFARRRARELRAATSDEEHRLWLELRTFRQYGAAFRRQAPVGPFIADFLCRKAKLIVEVDGRTHDDADKRAHDAARDAFLASEGYRVIRFAAHDVWQDLDGVVTGIEAALRDRLIGR